MSKDQITIAYKGIEFKSFLEAKWAVFFDEAGVKWTYPNQVFNLNGLNYAPSFYLPDVQVWIAIETEEPQAIEREAAARLCQQIKQNVYIFYGEPEYDDDFGTWCQNETLYFVQIDIENGWPYTKEEALSNPSICGGVDNINRVFQYGGFAANSMIPGLDACCGCSEESAYRGMESFHRLY